VIAVYCAGTPAAEHARHEFALLAALNDKIALIRPEDAAATRAALRAGDTLIQHFTDGPSELTYLYRRWSWLCPRCGDHLVVKDDKLHPALLRLADHGEAEVSIRVLRRML
jgi:hypothetical protein